jgi:hypothetical protein
VSFVDITLRVAFQRVLIVVSVYFVIDSVRKLLDIPSYVFATELYKVILIQRFDSTHPDLKGPWGSSPCSFMRINFRTLAEP